MGTKKEIDSPHAFTPATAATATTAATAATALLPTTDARVHVRLVR